MQTRVLFLIIFSLPIAARSQPKTDTTLQNVFQTSKDSLLRSVLDNPDIYRYQIIYTQINRDKNNKPSFKNYYYNVDPHRYFNPASMVKLPLAFLSLEKLGQMKKTGVNKFTSMFFDSAWSKQTILHTDSTSENGLPSIGQFIRKAFLISDNDAYNRMYEFVGQQNINRRLHSMGYSDTRIARQFTGMSAEENRHTNPIRFVDQNRRLIYEQPMQFNRDSFDFSRTLKMGNAYKTRDTVINEPLDFTRANNYPLEDMQQTLQSVLFPESVATGRRFQLSKEDHEFLYRYLSQFPSETAYPKYDTSIFYDSYAKFFFRQGSHNMPDGVRVFNKVGWAYGCLTDVSYVVDFKNEIEFMLSVTVYVNSDGVLNDNKYDYETIGWPFLYKIGQAMYKYELNRPRHYRPVLSRFKMKYEKRKENGRQAIREVDN